MYGRAQNLKSNMDRFIAVLVTVLLDKGVYLKSNMDRFIVLRISLV